MMAPPVSAQTAPAPVAAPERAGDTKEALRLSPFEVTATSGRDYRAVDAMTSSGIATKLVDSPQNISVITEAFIKDLNLDSLHQTLLYTSGVQIDEYNRDAGGVLVRGFGISSYLRDGIARPYNAVTENIERIEVVKGPVSAFFSQSSPGGIVNYITKKPEFVRKGSLTLNYGSYDYRVVGLDVQSPLLPNSKTLGFRLVAGARRTNNWRRWEYIHRDYFAPSLRWRPNKYLDIKYQYEWAKSSENLLNNGRTNLQFHADWANPPQDVIAFNRNATRPTDAAVVSFLKTRWLRAIATWAADIKAVRGGLAPPVVTTGDLTRFFPDGRNYNTGGPGAIHDYKNFANDASVTITPVPWIAARYTHGFFKGFSDQYNAFGFPNADGTIPYAERSAVSWNRTASDAADLLIDRAIGPVRNRLLFGWQRIVTNTRSSSRRFDYSVLRPVVRNGVTLSGRDVALNYNPFVDPVIDVQQILKEIVPTATPSDGGSTGRYATWQTEFWDRRVHTQVGIRQDQARSGEKYDATPTFGVNFAFRPGLVAYASYSENFLVNGNNVSGQGVLPGEAKRLPPAFGKGTEVGLKTDWRENTFSGTVSLFRLENSGRAATDAVRNLIEPRNTDAISTNNVVWTSTGGTWQTEGVGLDLIWTPGSYFQGQVAYDYTWKAKIVSDQQWIPGTPEYAFQIGRRITNAPEHALKIFGKYSFERGRLKNLSIGAGGRYVAPTIGGNASTPSQIVYMSSYTVYDAILGYSAKQWLRKPITFSLAIQNLTNHIYLQGTNNIFGNPRKLFLSTTVNF